MAFLNTKLNLPFYNKLAMVLVSIISLGYLCVLGKEILSPLVYSFLFAILLVPLAGKLETRFKLPRGAAAGISVIVSMVLIFSVIYFLASQLSDLAGDWPMFKKAYMKTLYDLQHWIAKSFNVKMSKQLNYLNEATSSLISSSTSIIGATVMSLSSIMLFLVFVIIDTFFLLFYRRHIIRFLIAVFKEENAAPVYEIVAQVQFIIRKYILGLLLEMAIVTAVCCIAFYFIGIRYALLLGFLTGILNIIPYIGIFTSLVLSTVITIGTAASTGTIFFVMGTIVVMHLVDSNFLLPFIVGSKVKINALITLLGVVAGEMLWGISGMFLSIPMLAITKIVFDRIESLQPWGFLLGDEKDEVQPGNPAEAMQPKEEPSLEQDMLHTTGAVIPEDENHIGK